MKALRLLPMMFFLLSPVLFHEPAQAGFVKKKTRPKVKPETWRVPSPPIKTPSQSPIVASTNPYQQCRATVMPSFISHSMGMDETGYRSFKALSPPSILVHAAGNSHPQPLSSAENKASRDYNAIIVGSMSPEGVRSSFSQEGEAVTIMAPSDHYLTSATSTGHYRKYSGTSGATPLVTGSLAGFEWMAGYHPTAEEAKTLLEKTAIPTPYSKDKPRKNGAGMVNAYKLAMVGKQLKQACGKNISCFKDLIKKDDIYQFPEDEAVIEALDKAFPYCSSTCTAEELKTESSCADKAQAFKDLRKQAFLNPQNKALWKKMACVYAQGGFGKNTAFALNIYNTLSGRPNRDPIGSSGGYLADIYCQKDEDCALATPCSEKPGSRLQIMSRSFVERHYLQCLEQNRKYPLCNGKCRCGSQESITEPLSSPAKPGSEDEKRKRRVQSTTTYSVACINFQCIKGMKVEISDMPAEPPAPKQKAEPPANPTGGGAVR